MPFSDLYSRQVRLLVRILPYIADEPVFALKGGTAINLFHHDMPRLSVDIDLTYLPVAPRDESLADIDATMKRIAKVARDMSPAKDVTEQAPPRGQNAVTRLIARGEGVQIKIEVTPVLRGCVYEPELRTASPRVEEKYGFVETNVVSFADLFAGKIVAALDRQHPRDLFDIRGLLAGEGIDDRLRKAFIVYLISHNRPMHEVLGAAQKDIAHEFEHGFDGMTEQAVSIEDLLEAREDMVAHVIRDMPGDHREFLISFERGEPDWRLLGLETAEKLPAVLWRQHNLDKLEDIDRNALVDNLKRALAV